MKNNLRYAGALKKASYVIICSRASQFYILLKIIIIFFNVFAYFIGDCDGLQPWSSAHWLCIDVLRLCVGCCPLLVRIVGVSSFGFFGRSRTPKVINRILFKLSVCMCVYIDFND